MNKTRSLPQTASEWIDFKRLPRESFSSDSYQEHEPQEESVLDPNQAYKALIAALLAASNSCITHRSDCDSSYSVESEENASSVNNSKRTTPSYAAWLAVVFPAKEKTFTWRFCVLKGNKFKIFVDEDLENPNLLSCHSLVHVERLHFINRGFCVFDQAKQQVWLHTDSDNESFETWLALCHHAIQSCLSSTPDMLKLHDDIVTASDLRRGSLGRNKPLTGWFMVRRVYIRNWLFGRRRSMYVTLCDRVFAGFYVDLEGKWADFHGDVKSFRARASALEILLEDGRVMQLCGKKKRPVEKKWFAYLEEACHPALAASLDATLSLPTSLLSNTTIEVEL